MRPKLWEDTSPDAERVLIEGYRRMTHARKAGKVASLTSAVQQLALARLRAARPERTDAELQRELAALWLPADLLERVLAHRRAQSGR
jgi:hypothetical protein